VPKAPAAEAPWIYRAFRETLSKSFTTVSRACWELVPSAPWRPA
jgi:hypothetical protein